MRLLIVEDERALARALLTLLDKNGYSADAVYDGEEALQYLEHGDYDGVILDVMLPYVDGFEVLRRVRESGNMVSILMLTAKSDVDDKVAGLDGGANDYLTKPFATKELLARIRVMTRTEAASVDSILRVGNIRLNRATNELSSPTGSFRLTNKEFQMMEFLIFWQIMMGHFQSHLFIKTMMKKGGISRGYLRKRHTKVDISLYRLIQKEIFCQQIPEGLPQWMKKLQKNMEKRLLPDKDKEDFLGNTDISKQNKMTVGFLFF